MITPDAGSRRNLGDNLWSVIRLAWHEDWRLVTGRGALRVLSAGIPAAQAYIWTLVFDTLSAGYGLGGWYVLLLFGPTIPALLIGLREGRMVYTWQRAWGKWYRYVNYFRHVVFLPQFIMELRLYRLAPHFIACFWDSARTFMRAYFWFELRRQRLNALKTLLPDLGYLCGVAALARGVVSGAVTVGDAVMFISHRFSTVRQADTILLLDEGRIRAEGSHEELVSRDAGYVEMFEAQAQWYRSWRRTYHGDHPLPAGIPLRTAWLRRLTSCYGSRSAWTGCTWRLSGVPSPRVAGMVAAPDYLLQMRAHFWFTGALGARLFHQLHRRRGIAATGLGP